jgi:transposase
MGGADLLNDRTLAGLDVHLGQTQAAALDVASGELSFRRVSGPPRGVVDYLLTLPGPVLAVYEAGPVGYGLARAGLVCGIDVRVCAPGSIPRAPADRVKTDRRDAERLARQLLAGDLSFVRVPSVEEEQFRDLARCREAARGDLTRARHRLSKFLLRREHYFPGQDSNWTQAHHRWLRQLLQRPATLTSFLGIVPSEHSSGEIRRFGPITKTGSPHARRLLVEAAHHYRHTPAISAVLERRQRGQDPRACQIARRAQQRLHRQWQRLRHQRHKPANVAVIALARELATFVWEIGQLD